MTTYTLIQVDAFTDELFKGNPAAVVPLTDWLPDDVLQATAVENNLSETAYVIERDRDAGLYDLRWFTPGNEVDLCGHATLATAHALYTELGATAPALTFETRSGALIVKRTGDQYVMDFPLNPVAGPADPAGLTDALGAAPTEAFEIPNIHGPAYRVALFETAEQVKALAPDFSLMKKTANIIATARGDTERGPADFVCRFFAPASAIDEDPVTGSAYTTLGPLWAERLGKSKMAAHQVSPRGGRLICEIIDDRIHLTGSAVTYLKGQFSL